MDHVDPELLANFSFAQSIVSHIPPFSSTLPLYNDVASFLDSKKGNVPLVIAGESGVGKSALLARYLLDFYEKEKKEDGESTKPQEKHAASTPPTAIPTSTATSTPSSPQSPSPSASPVKTFGTSPSKYTPKKYQNLKDITSTPSAAQSKDKPSSAIAPPKRQAFKEKAKSLIIIPHFIGCSPTSTNRYEILRKVIFKLHTELDILRTYCYYV